MNAGMIILIMQECMNECRNEHRGSACSGFFAQTGRELTHVAYMYMCQLTHADLV
jgi:hypothetical protein